MARNAVLWAIYAVFAGCALYAGREAGPFSFEGPLAGVKAVVWLVWLAVLAYSLYCSRRENLFRTVGKIGELHWGRQIGTDLYLGLGLALLVIYLNEGGVVALLWLLPTLAFANLAILLYFAIHFDGIVARFLG
jgi:hypothetical protein